MREDFGGVGFMTELDRRAQIEEAWARRAVFAEAMAAERFADYVARRELGRLRSFAPPIPPPVVARGGAPRKRSENVIHRTEQAVTRLARARLVEVPHRILAEKPANDALVAVPAKKTTRRARSDSAAAVAK
ncbi:MAG TPA: hypothetical protein VHV26_01085 [Rhizomicrobium sp.]|jgi:hypothetical protein|nr:hypothetical protein [Rhizomicrobium sp.]